MCLFLLIKFLCFYSNLIFKIDKWIYGKQRKIFEFNKTKGRRCKRNRIKF